MGQKGSIIGARALHCDVGVRHFEYGRGYLWSLKTCSLYGKGDRGISNFFREANNKDVLGEQTDE